MAAAPTEIAAQIPTLPTVLDDRAAIRARNWRRLGMTVVWLLLAAALLGLLGVRMGTTTASADGWTLAVETPTITRGALDAPVTITVTRPSGFDRDVNLRIDRTLFSHLDVNLVVPAPSAETWSASQVEWTFDPPDGDVLRITIDARMAPAEMPGSDRLRFAVVDRGSVVVEVVPRLVVLP